MQSFGSGSLIRALQLLRRGQRYVDPSLSERLEQGEAVLLSGRERQVLDGLVRGLTNRQIAAENEIATTTGVSTSAACFANWEPPIAPRR